MSEEYDPKQQARLSRALNALGYRWDLDHLPALLRARSMTDEDLLSVPGIGPKGLREIRATIRECIRPCYATVGWIGCRLPDGHHWPHDYGFSNAPQ